MQSGWHSHYTSVSSLKCLQINNLFCFFFNDTATTEIYTLSLHDALPISERALEGVLAEHRVAQHGEHQRGLLIRRPRDRKSTRLNSSHGYISYAVFCLKKKKTIRDRLHPTLPWCPPPRPTHCGLPYPNNI